MLRTPQWICEALITLIEQADFAALYGVTHQYNLPLLL
ncbi:hypothetical protein JOC58_000641 [Paenibacillus hunanensis]|uniref:Uncharacterized protein n=1 Tax=Paenibacillus hunanensis TaxID=539262 RepID=A0ABU1IWJ2_9BACL|nr:hypothetical protein [Paenibacillus hunanensis]